MCSTSKGASLEDLGAALRKRGVTYNNVRYDYSAEDYLI
jgi:hypothetical protein